MNLEHFANILQQQTLKKEDINNLLEIINKYPYFQSARALYLKGLKNTEDFKYNETLRTTAAYTTDRRILFNYIASDVFVQDEVSKYLKQNAFPLNTIKVEVEDISVNKSMIIDDALEKEIENSKPVLDPALFQPVETSNKTKDLKITEDVKSFQIKDFSNSTILADSNLNKDFTSALQRLIQNKTQLELVTDIGDLVYEGEIEENTTAPITENNTATKNRLTISVKVKFFNKKKEANNFDQTFSFFYDFLDSESISENDKASAFDEILERLTQDVFNASLAK